MPEPLTIESVEELLQMKVERDTLRKFAGHKDRCAYYINPYERYSHCTCGWNDIRDTLPESWRYHH